MKYLVSIITIDDDLIIKYGLEFSKENNIFFRDEDNASDFIYNNSHDYYINESGYGEPIREENFDFEYSGGGVISSNHVENLEDKYGLEFYSVSYDSDDDIDFAEICFVKDEVSENISFKLFDVVRGYVFATLLKD